MKKTKSILSLFITAIMVAVSLQTDAQARPFTTISGQTDTIANGVGTSKMYCINYNPAEEIMVQVEIKPVAQVTAHDSTYGVVTVWGSNDNYSYVQLKQLDIYNQGILASAGPVNFSDSLNIATGTHGVGAAGTSTKIWTYDIHRTSQPLPRYFQVRFINKLVSTSTDSTDFSATLMVNP